MTNKDFDNIPLLDDLVTRGDSILTIHNTEQTEQTEQDTLAPHADLEQKIHDILQRHTSQATAEILAIIKTTPK